MNEKINRMSELERRNKIRALIDEINEFTKSIKEKNEKQKERQQ